MAEHRAKTKYKAPPTFYGRENEDAASWLDRYERAGRYNKWTDEDLHDNFEMFIEGDARLWYLGCESGDEVPDEWTVPDADMEAEYDKVDEKNTLGLRELFLKQFTPADYETYYHEKLQNRRQGFDESVTTYYYAVMELIRIVDKRMPEKTKLKHLLRGLRPEVMEKLWMLQPKTCAEFLKLAEAHRQITDRVKDLCQERTVAFTQCDNRLKDIEKLMEKPHPGNAKIIPPTREPGNNSEPEKRQLTERLDRIEAMLSQLQCGQERPRPPPVPQPHPRSGRRADRTPDGKPICFRCGRAGHIGRNCPMNVPMSGPTGFVHGAASAPTRGPWTPAAPPPG